jgi:acetolactate decarboxylase
VRPRFALLIGLLLLLTLPAFAQAPLDRDMLYQVSTLDALLAGLMDGVTTVGDLLRHGNIGLGTYQAVDGEMVILDGKAYQVRADGTVHLMPPGARSPFAAVSTLDVDQTVALNAPYDMKALLAYLDTQLPSLNYFYVMRLDGEFAHVKTRSVPRQHKPYPFLTTVAATQPVFDMDNVSGTLVILRSPYFTQGMNFPGYHLHFLTADRKQGGHVLDFKLTRGQVTIDLTPRAQLVLPETPDFAKTKLPGTPPGSVEKVEKGGQ